MINMLTTRQVQNILKVDRITIYRMLQDGRLKGIKVGSQWRFANQEVERLLSGDARVVEQPLPDTSTSFPTHCVQTIQDLFSAVSQISGLVVDKQGDLLTQPSYPCDFCRLIVQEPSGLDACRASWKEIARQSETGAAVFTCHAGIQYFAAPIEDGNKVVAFFLAGQFYWQAPDPRENSQRIQQLAQVHNLSLEGLLRAANAVPIIESSQRTQAAGWPHSAARAIQSILLERTNFVQRLQQIADLTQIP
jgi:excisionase family DNA binding protein